MTFKNIYAFITRFYCYCNTNEVHMQYTIKILGQKRAKKRKYKLDCNSHAEVVVVTAESPMQPLLSFTCQWFEGNNVAGLQ